MKNLMLISCFIMGAHTMWPQELLQIQPFLQQQATYFSSERVTAYGFGFGAGTVLVWKGKMVLQPDVNLLWGNGNALNTRVALGYQRSGKWAPAVFATTSVLWGQRTEILDAEGQRPPVPAWAVGIRIAPLKFRNSRGFLSLLEVGYALGPAHGRCIEMSIVAIGAWF